MANTKLNFTSKTGAKVTLVLNYRSWVDDNGQIGAEATTELVINGINKGEIHHVSEPIASNPKHQDIIKAGCTVSACIYGKGNSIQVIGLTGITMDEITTAWATLRDTTDSAQVKAIQAARESISHKDDVAEAQYIMSNVDNTIKLMGALPTKIQAMAYRESFKRINNEGQDGYLPNIVTIDQVEWAKNILN